MHINTIALIISILGTVLSFGVVGIIPSIIAFVLNIYCVQREKSINTIRSLAISIVGILLPIIMYAHSYGFSLPYEKIENVGIIRQMVYDNYTRLGFDVSGLIKGKEAASPNTYLGDGSSDMYYVSDGVEFDDSGVHVSPDEAGSGNGTSDGKNGKGSGDAASAPGGDAANGGSGAGSDSANSGDTTNIKYGINGEPLTENAYAKPKSIDDADAYISIDLENSEIFEAIDSNKERGLMALAKSDDEIPSYGGLPIGTLIVGQYFREDDHNCNPILVLQNKTGNACRFECVFTARDKDGNELAVSQKTVEVVKNEALFVFEGRFDKYELGGQIPAMYEFLVSKRDPYEKDMYDEVTVAGQINNYSVIVTAQNHSDKSVKVDTYVLFFDKDELVDCIWMIPRNGEDVTIQPQNAAAIRADAYYKFDRIETYYTAYEAVAGE